jgi:hypothetical protein
VIAPVTRFAVQGDAGIRCSHGRRQVGQRKYQRRAALERLRFGRPLARQKQSFVTLVTAGGLTRIRSPVETPAGSEFWHFPLLERPPPATGCMRRLSPLRPTISHRKPGSRMASGAERPSAPFFGSGARCNWMNAVKTMKEGHAKNSVLLLLEAYAGAMRAYEAAIRSRYDDYVGARFLHDPIQTEWETGFKFGFEAGFSRAMKNARARQQVDRARVGLATLNALQHPRAPGRRIAGSARLR